MSIEAAVFPESGQTIVAGLQLAGELGRGASTIVCRARRQGVDYALKILRDRVAYGEQRSVAFRREAAMLACVTHPGLPRIHEVGYALGRPFIVMELVDGKNLEVSLTDGPMS